MVGATHADGLPHPANSPGDGSQFGPCLQSTCKQPAGGHSTSLLVASSSTRTVRSFVDKNGEMGPRPVQHSPARNSNHLVSGHNSCEIKSVAIPPRSSGLHPSSDDLQPNSISKRTATGQRSSKPACKGGRVQRPF